MCICPRCEQEYLVDALIKSLRASIVICPECEAFWTQDTPIGIATFRDFGDYMESRGLPGNWRMLVVSGQHRQPNP